MKYLTNVLIALLFTTQINTQQIQFEDITQRSSKIAEQLAALYGSIDQGHVIESNESILLPDGETTKVFNTKKDFVFTGS